MKKILSIILCAALVIGMLPAVFATTTEETDTLEYVFSSEAVGSTGTVAPDAATHTYEAVEEDVSPNKWAFGVAYVYKSRGLEANLQPGAFSFSSFNDYCAANPNNAIMFKINVPEGADGTYMPEISYFNHPNGGTMSVYIAPESAMTADWLATPANAVTDYNNNPSTTQLKRIVNAKDTYDANGISSNAYDETKIKTASENEALKLTAGDYYLIFAITGYNANAPTATVGSRAAYYIHPSALTLTKLTPASIEVSAGSTEIDINGTTKLTSVVKTADGTEIDAKVNYSSSNAIVTVDEEGNVTAGNVPGTATITATVDGTTISDTVTIKVTKNYTYAFSGTETTGDWKLLAQEGLVSANIKNSRCYLANKLNAEGGHYRNVAAFEISFEEKGIYVPTLTVNPYNGGGILSVYLVPATWAESQNIFGDDNLLNDPDEANSLRRVAIANNKRIGSADTYSEATSATAANTFPHTFDETEITENKYYLIFSITGNHQDAINYENSNGIKGYYAYISSLSFKKVGEVENVEAPTVALAVAYGDEDPTVTSYPRGKEITVTAPDKTDENLTFRHWVRGTADGGDWVSSNTSYSFTLATNTYITAVYTATAAETEKIVEFWGGNGEYLTEAKADADGKVTFPENPKMTGFEFLQWIVAKNTPVTADTVFADAITRVVAEFGDDEDVKFKVDGTDYLYDAKVHKEADEEKAWYRDNVLVGYGETYEHYVWDAVGSIEARDISGEKAPVVVLDSTVKEEKACMIEYDTAGKDVTEVGIVFGTSSATIDSCNSKATSQKKLTHGQFTAKPNANGNAAYARGYIIYNDAGVYRVTYTAPVALNS